MSSVRKKFRRRPPNESSSLARGTLSIFASNIGTNLLGLASGILLARSLGPDGRGEYQVAVLCYLIIPSIVGLNLGTIIASTTSGQKVPIPHLRLTLSCLIGLGGLIAGAIGLLSGLGGVASSVLTISAFGYMSSDVLQGMARRYEKYGLYAAVRWADLGGSSVVIVLLYVLDILTVVTAICALTFTTCIAMAFLYFKVSQISAHESGFSRPAPLSHIMKVHAGGATRVLSTFLDQVIIGVLLGYTPLGIYALAFSLASQLNVVQGALVTVGFNVVRRDAQDGGRRVAFLVRAQTVLAVLASASCWLLGPSFFALIFGDEFRQAGTVATLLLLAVGLAGVVGILEVVLVAGDAAGEALSARLAGLCSLPISVCFTYFQGTVLAAASIPLLIYMVSSIAIVFMGRRRALLDLRALFRLPGANDLASMRSIVEGFRMKRRPREDDAREMGGHAS